MATNIDTINVSNTDYYVAANTAAVNSFTSGDSTDSGATAWTSVAALATTDNNKTIWEKLSKMFKNIRYVYNQLANKANATHTHAASNITSGTLTVDYGGTGITSNPSMLIKLNSTTADTVFKASPRPGVRGKIRLANLPTSSTHTNSNSYIPTSALVYSLNNDILALKSRMGV